MAASADAPIGRTDCLFLHVGQKARGGRGILIMPMGALALADMLDSAGILTRVLNLPLMELARPGFSLASFLAGCAPRLVCIPLHWHQQAKEVLAVSRRMGRWLPDAKVILGGFTATRFHSEIMAQWPSVDFVVRGDAEKPLGLLAERIMAGGSDFSDVPNLCWRRNGRPVANPLSYAATRAELDRLRYARFGLIVNKDECLKGRWRLSFDGAGEALRTGPSWFFYNPGRGCSWSCSFCGGCAQSQRSLNRRTGPVWKSPESALADLSDSWRQGVRRWYACFDPDPARAWYLDFMARLRKAKLRFTMVFESWSLPTPGFLREFRRCFSEDSLIVLSPETGVEELRQRNKGPSFTNAEFVACMEELKRLGIHAELYFTSGLPFETRSDFARTVRFILDLSRRFDFRLSAFPLQLEPASPMSENPSSFGVRPLRRTLADYARSVPDPGYATSTLSPARIRLHIRILRSLLESRVGRFARQELVQ